ncbi:MAG: SagB/ThcOx family dehydrogenase [Bacillota bacterium]|nr:SagB/ThcOx family dehydrogenase [Bacillota bacterium]
MTTKDIRELREFLTTNSWLKMDLTLSDENKNVPMPPVQKAPLPCQELIHLPDINRDILKNEDIISIIKDRKSRRRYSNCALSLPELSFLLWATQGVRKTTKNYTLRNVASAGNSHTFETYLAVFHVKELKEGIYRYLPLEHALVFEFSVSNLSEKMVELGRNYHYVGKSAVTFIWTTIPYRMEWRYMESSARLIAIDAGHVCQNLYLACEAIGCGTCAIGAFVQSKADELLQLDGKEEFVFYMAPVGKQL